MIHDEKSLEKISFDELMLNIEDISKYNIPVWRKKKNNDIVIFPTLHIEKYIGMESAEDLSLYIQNDWQEMIAKQHSKGKQEKDVIRKSKIELITEDDNKEKDNEECITEQNVPRSSTNDSFDSKIKQFSEMSHKEREDLFDENISIILQRAETSGELDIGSIENMVKVAADAFFINKVSLEENFENKTEVLRDHIQKIAKKTTTLVDSVIRIIKNNKVATHYYNQLMQKSSGSTIDHMTHVFLLFIPFCLYFNNYTSIWKISKIRANFKSQFFPFYEKLLPNVNNIHVESVLSGGIQEINAYAMLQYAIGALLHDIGKLHNIEYFEGEEGYNRETVMQHVPYTYFMIAKSKEFSQEVAILSALHHEYYHDKSGYGMTERIFKNFDPHSRTIQHCMSVNLLDVKNSTALAFLPAKMLEIVDIFDALIDKNRNYREMTYSPEEAILVMRKTFIEYNLKIDPLLFSIFTSFILDNAIIKDASYIENYII